ncbi:MAG: hypothetical protein NTW16_18015 [Bacteroidetes bacterium]|nr:hypothetical protein [Bacteroidota bacterium]
MKRDFRELVISGMTDIAKIEWFIEEICDSYHINNEYFGNILLATNEAVGILFSLNDSDKNCEVTVGFNRSQKGLEFTINLNCLKPGFNESEDFLDQEIRKHKLSRDIFIIKALIDEIAISGDGKSIRIVFYISSINYEKSLTRITELRKYWKKREILIHGK